MAERTNEELCAMAAAGDEESFEFLLIKHFFIQIHAHDDHVSVTVFRNVYRFLRHMAEFGYLRRVFQILDRYYFCHHVSPFPFIMVI